MECSRRDAVGLMLAGMPAALLAQLPGQPVQRPGPPGMQQPADPLNPIGPEEDTRVSREVEQKQVIIRETERQKRLVADTDKLLVLATELKVDVEKTDKNILSIDVVRKAEEIERLAKSVKDRMKG